MPVPDSSKAAEDAPALTGPAALGAAPHSSGSDGRPFGLSRRESEVLKLLTEGLTNGAIAARLFISEETVKSHVRAVMRKLGVQDRKQAASLALREGIVE